MFPPLHRALMLDRMLAADRTFDGRFITGVVSTGIYCLPSCRARKPKPENVTFHFTLQSARDAGLRACLRCKPDEYYAGVHDGERRVETLTALLTADPAAARNVTDLAALAGVSASKLHDLFREHLHTTPAEWLTRLRVTHAQTLLLRTTRTAADIAFTVGFESLSAFGEQFRRWSALTPLAYRRLPDVGTARLTLPGAYPTGAVLRDLNRDPHSLTDRVDGPTYHAALRLGTGPVVVRVDFTPSEAVCTPLVPPGTPLDWAQLHTLLLRRLGLAHDPARFEAHVTADPALAAVMDGGRGLRSPLITDPFDGLVWSILGQQVNYAYACTLRRRLVQRAGQPLTHDLWAPPTAADVAALSETDLTGLGLTRARAGYLRRAAQAVASGHLPLHALAAGTATRAERTLLALPGIGPWSAHYVMLRAFGFQDCVPIGDTALATELQRLFALPGRPDRQQTQQLMSRYAPHRTLATLHLWRRFQAHKETP